MREWPRYRAWLEEDRVGRRLHAHLTDAARAWDAGGRETGDLYRGARLTAALGWAARTERDGWVLARDAAQIRLADVYRAFVFDADAVGLPQADLGLSLRDYLGKDKAHEPAVVSPP